MAILGTNAKELTQLIGSIPDSQLILVPDPITGKLMRSTFGQLKADVILSFGAITYLDQIIEVDQVADLPQPGVIKTIYVITGAGDDQNKQFRWGGSVYIEFPQGSGDVGAEAILRGNADAALQADIDAANASLANAQTTLQGNINTETTGRTNADTQLTARINAEINARQNGDNILSGLINSEGTIRAQQDNLLSDRIDNKVDKIAGMSLSSNDFTTDEKTKLAGMESAKFKGTYINLAALNAANVGGEGNYADVDAGAGADVARWIWDNTDNKWVLQEGTSTAETAASIKTKYESNPDTNAYTDAEKAKLTGLNNYDDTAINTALANKVDKVAGKQLSTEDYTTIEKTKLASIAAGAQVNDANTTTQGNVFNGNSQLVKTDAAGKLPPIDGSQLTNLPAGGAADNYATAAGTNTYTATIAGIATYSEGMSIRLKFTNGNTGASSININTLGAKNIFKGASTALTAGVITGGQIFELYYDGTAFQIGAVQAVPTAANKVITTNSSGALQAVNDLIDIVSSTSEATLLSKDWSLGSVTATGFAGQKVFGSTYEFTCVATNTWRRTPYNLIWNDLYLPPVSDSGGVKTSTQMASLYPSAVTNQRVKGSNGVYEYFGLAGWVYFPFTTI